MQRFCHRIVIATLTALLFIPVWAQAQDQSQGRRAAGQRQRQHMAMLAEKLGLTDAQKAQFQQINRGMWQQGRAIRQNSSLTDDQKKQKIQELRQQSHKQMFSVLRPEQKEKLKQMREEHKKEQEKDKASGDQASAKKKPSTASDDDDPFAGMTSDDDDAPGNGSSLQ